MGSPVLFGKSTNRIMQLASNGLFVPSPFNSFLGGPLDPSTYGNGICPNSTTVVAMNFIPVQFGYDLTTGCVLKLTRPELESLCCTGRSSCAGMIASSEYVSNSTGVPVFLSGQFSGYVAKYGNADPFDINQWIPLKIQSATSTKVWSAASGGCSNVISGINYNFLVTATGERNSPQNMIQAASVSFVTSSWASSAPVGDNVTAQAFELSVTVTFVYNQEVS